MIGLPLLKMEEIMRRFLYVLFALLLMFFVTACADAVLETEPVLDTAPEIGDIVPPRGVPV